MKKNLKKSLFFAGVAICSLLVGVFMSNFFYIQSYERGALCRDLRALKVAYLTHRAIVEGKTAVALELQKNEFFFSLTLYRGYYDFSPVALTNETAVVEGLEWFNSKDDEKGGWGRSREVNSDNTQTVEVRAE